MNDTPTDADLTRLADGSLPDAQAAALRERVGSDPELRARLGEQERAVSLMRSTDEIVAPASLHAAVHGQVSARSGSPARGRPAWRARLLAPLATAAVAAAVIVIVLVSEGSSSLTVTRTAQLALASPTRSAPAVDPTASDLLSLGVGSIRFPAYSQRTGWRATGARTDQIDGRRVQTVFYDIAGRRVGYSIAAGATLRVPRGSARTVDGVRYVVTGVGPARLITWRRAGHTCVIAGRGIDARMLLTLATASQTA